MGWEIDRQIGVVSAVSDAGAEAVFVVKRELSQNAKLPIYMSICSPTLAYCHELWVVFPII